MHTHSILHCTQAYSYLASYVYLAMYIHGQLHVNLLVVKITAIIIIFVHKPV